jgi:hypothetical protein
MTMSIDLDISHFQKEDEKIVVMGLDKNNNVWKIKLDHKSQRLLAHYLIKENLK